MRGVPWFVAPLKKTLLCNPVCKPKMIHPKSALSKMGTSQTLLPQQERRNLQLVAGAAPGAPVEEQAQFLLLKTSGILGPDGVISEDANLQFGQQFVGPVQDQLVTEFRAAFRLPVDGAVGTLDALIGDAVA